jgi:hypothetical protein
MLAFHRERDIQISRGQGRNDNGQFFVRQRFADPAHAEACISFGGKRLSAKPLCVSLNHRGSCLRLLGDNREG